MDQAGIIRDLLSWLEGHLDQPLSLDNVAAKAGYSKWHLQRMFKDAHTLAKLATPFGEGEALRLSSVSHPEYVPRVANFFRETGGRALLMHGTEGEVYANPQRCPQISLIDEQGVRVLYERQTEMAAEAVVLPTSKDPEVTARWIERCVAGVEPVPTSLKIQLACCLVACGEVTSLEQGLSRVNDCW